MIGFWIFIGFIILCILGGCGTWFYNLLRKYSRAKEDYDLYSNSKHVTQDPRIANNAKTRKNKMRNCIFCMVASVILCVSLSGGTIIGANWFVNNTASGIRMQTTWESQINIGLNRTVTVYSVTGELIYEISGHLDVVHDGYRILFDMVEEDGTIKRHIIYPGAGTVVIKEN